MAKTDDSFYVKKWLITLESEQPVFDAAEVCALTGISPATLQNWANRSLISGEATRKGKGGVRKYSRQSLCLIKLARALMPLGLEASGAVNTASNVLVALIKGLATRPMPDQQIVKTVASIFADPLGRQAVILLDTTDNKIRSYEAKPMAEASDAILVHVGTHIWHLYKACAAIEIEAKKSNAA